MRTEADQYYYEERVHAAARSILGGWAARLPIMESDATTACRDAAELAVKLVAFVDDALQEES